ncbi:hypothetical protein K438DRAFT_1794225 [Mycena galopus ATCC 62051]|nr:hypothetical protein K438DRAFT_1794225 [Mycena galopus ATCC 62051]
MARCLFLLLLPATIRLWGVAFYALCNHGVEVGTFHGPQVSFKIEMADKGMLGKQLGIYGVQRTEEGWGHDHMSQKSHLRNALRIIVVYKNWNRLKRWGIVPIIQSEGLVREREHTPSGHKPEDL